MKTERQTCYFLMILKMDHLQKKTYPTTTKKYENLPILSTSVNVKKKLQTKYIPSFFKSQLITYHIHIQYDYMNFKK